MSKVVTLFGYEAAERYRKLAVSAKPCLGTDGLTIPRHPCLACQGDSSCQGDG